MEGDNFTAEELECVKQLRQELPAEPTARVDDFYLVRFIRARSGKYAAAKLMLENHFKWREEVGADTLLDNPPPKTQLMRQIWAGTLHKENRDDCPVLMVPYGHFLSDGIQDVISLEEYPAIAACIMEGIMQRLEELSKQHHRRISKITSVFDMSGLNMGARRMFPYLRRASAMNADHYPEVLGHLVLINCPWVFPTLFNLIKPLIDPVVKSKLHIFQDSGTEALLKIIPPENLPQQYGGSCVCPKGCMPKRVSPSVKQSTDSEDVPEDLEDVSVAAGDLLERKLQAGPEGGVFGWYFTANSDVDFTVQFFDTSAEGKSHTPTNVLETTRIKGKEPTVGSYSSSAQGYCKFTWSNEHSVFRSKQLKLSVTCSDLNLAEKDTDEASSEM